MPPQTTPTPDATIDERPFAERAVAGPAPRLAADDLVDADLLDLMMSRVDKSGLRLTGEGGFLPALIKAVLERGLQAELTDHLGYERGDPAGRGAPNSRNGTTPKTVATEVGEVGLDTPRDRDSSFEPRLVPKGARRLAGGLDEQIISLYAGGMTVRDIGYHFERTLGVQLSHETISKITEAVAEEVTAWQTRPLDEVYPIVYIDALVVKVRDSGHVTNKAAHLVVGVDTDGIKHVLGIWVQSAEGAKFWLSVLTELRHLDCGHICLSAANNLAEWHLGHGDPQAGLEWADRGLSAPFAQAMPPRRAVLLDIKGIALALLGRFADAEESLLAACQTLPDGPEPETLSEITWALAVVEDRLGRIGVAGALRRVAEHLSARGGWTLYPAVTRLLATFPINAPPVVRLPFADDASPGDVTRWVVETVSHRYWLTAMPGSA